MVYRIGHFIRKRRWALAWSGATIAFVAFALSVWGGRYGDAIDDYSALIYLPILVIIALLALHEWWTGQSGAAGGRFTVSRLMTWWRRWGTDWGWDRNR